MITIHPFPALMPAPERAQQVAAVPYDVVTTPEATALAAENTLSFLRVSRPEIELPPGTDPYADAVYARARENFQRLQADAPLVFDKTPSLYVYAMTMNGKRQVGIAAAVAVDDYDAQRIKTHELTRPDKEDDRTRHVLAVASHTGPVFLIHKTNPGVDTAVGEAMTAAPTLSVTAEGDVRHDIWRLPHALAARIVSLFRDMPALYVADGHHRAKSASRAREARRQANPKHDGSEDYNRFLAVIFPAEQLQILAYNRMIKDLHGQTPDQFLAAVRNNFTVEPTTPSVPGQKGVIHMYLPGQWYRLAPKTKAPADRPQDALDVSILQRQLLEPILGIADPRTDSRISFVGGPTSVVKLQRAVDSAAGAVAFSLFPVSVNELIAISDQGAIMPPKSTWFEPKLLDGLLCHCF